MTRGIVIIVLALLMTACGGQASNQSPAEVHAAWIEALQNNDRQAAQALVAPDSPVSVDRALEQAQYLVTLDTDRTGRLQAVDIEPPEEQGAGQIARSIWRLDKLTSCFRTTLAQTPQGWKVTGYEARLTGCPTVEVQP